MLTNLVKKMRTIPAIKSQRNTRNAKAFLRRRSFNVRIFRLKSRSQEQGTEKRCAFLVPRRDTKNTKCFFVPLCGFKPCDLEVKIIFCTPPTVR